MGTRVRIEVFGTEQHEVGLQKVQHAIAGQPVYVRPGGCVHFDVTQDTSLLIKQGPMAPRVESKKILVQLVDDGPHSYMDETELLRIDGGFEDENERTTWVQYHLITTGKLVHRSAHVQLKKHPDAPPPVGEVGNLR